MKYLLPLILVSAACEPISRTTTTDASQGSEDTGQNPNGTDGGSVGDGGGVMARVVEKCSAVVSSLTNKGGECGCAATIDAIEEIKLQKGRTPLRFGRRCAVVGSSGVLLDNATGPAIDAADQVIRCNYAPVKGYERYVGSKTTVRVSGAKNVYKIFSGKNKEVWAFEDAMREASNGERIFYSHQPLCREIRKLERDGREHVTVRNRATNRSFVAAYSPAYDAFLALCQAQPPLGGH